MSAAAYPNRGAITVSVMAATLLSMLDTTIVNVALPQIQGSLSASPEQVTWVLTSYIVATAISTPLSGWLGARFGMKRVILVTIAGFTAASMFCGIAASLPQMVLVRVVQGFFGAALIPLSQAVMLNINPPERHGRALSVWSAGVMLGPIVGPLIGGYLTESLSWRWCFYINLPVGLAALAGVAIFMPSHEETRRRPFDFLGFGALALAIGAVQMMLDRGPGEDWFTSFEICGYAVAAIIFFWIFLVHSLTAKHPFFDPALVRDRNLATSSVFNFLAGVVLFSSMAILPNLMQGLMGYPPMLAGVMNLPRGLGMLASILIAGRIAGLVDQRLLLLAGLSISGAGIWVSTWFDLSMDTTPLILSAVLQGFGTGFFSIPLNLLAFSTIGPAMRAEASSMYNLVRNLGSSAGIAGIQAMAVVSSQTMHAALAGRVNPEDQALRAALTPAFDPATLVGALALDAEITRQSMMTAYVNVFRFLLILCVAFMPLVLLLRRAPRGAAGASSIAVE
jgi:MFS transporter, DHA2 family, multidrug resistance protein